MSNIKHIYKTDGKYLGYIMDEYLFSWEGIGLGWLEGKFVWDVQGDFRGILTDVKGNSYIVINRFVLPPVSRPPRVPRIATVPQIPQTSIPAVQFPVGVEDAF